MKLTSNKSLTNIHLYNKDNQIQKFKDVYAIMDHHYYVRYNLYIKRKEYILNILKNKISILESKVKFIYEIIEDTITIYKKTRTDIIQQLYSKEYLLYENNVITLTSKKKFKSIRSEYDYLIKMPLYSLSQDKIDELTKDLEKNKLEYEKLEGKSIETMWREELKLLKSQLDRFYKNKN